MRLLWLALALLMAPLTASASGLENCELVVLVEVIDNDGGRIMEDSYPSAERFLAGVFNAEVPLTLKVDGALIRGINCVRNDLVPTQQDYAILATGIPLTLSQDFFSTDSDLLTVYFGNGAFKHKYISDYPMSEEFADAVQSRLANFSSRDHGLVNRNKN